VGFPWQTPNYPQEAEAKKHALAHLRTGHATRYLPRTPQDAEARGLFANPGAYDSWASTWRSRLAIDGREPKARAEAMRAVNPAFIPRNHRVEQALDAAIENADISPFVELLTVLSRPYQDQSAFAEYANPPQTGERVFRTFCGT